MAKLKGYTIKDGKITKKLPRKSVSQKIAARKSNKTRVVRRPPGD